MSLPSEIGGQYEFLTPETAVAYVAEHPQLNAILDPATIVEVREVGDGNLNLVFVLTGSASVGLVLKQALPYVRLVGPDWPMAPDRARHEAQAMVSHGVVAPDFVPRLYHFDPDRHVIGMEDLSDHQVWRHALNRGERHDHAATDIGDYVARVAFGTSIFGTDPREQKSRLADSVNAELCEITEDLIFTEPCVPAGRNSVLAANEPDALALAADAGMVREMGWLKWQFMTQAEALIHGDLHTGSIMVRSAGGGRPRSTKAFDSEFAFYGPVGFDLGILLANYIIAAARACAQREDDRAAWALALPGETWAAFENGFRSLWPQRRDPRLFTDEVLEEYLAKVELDAWGFAAAEMARRTVGLAKTSDIETLPEEIREGAARGILLVARSTATGRHEVSELGGLSAQAGDILMSARTP